MMTSRRKKIIVVGIVGVVLFLLAFSNSVRAVEVKRYDKFRELPVTSLKPRGWLKTYLQLQRDGLTGHLDKASGFPFNQAGWAAPYPEKGGDFGTYPEWGLWLDGMIRCGYLLEDNFLIQKAKTQFEYVLTHPAKNGILGPNWNDWTEVGPHEKGAWRYAQFRFFHALKAEFFATGDDRILPAMQKHYLIIPPIQHAIHQGVCNIEHMCALYGLTGNKQMMERALMAWQKVNEPEIAHFRNFDIPLDVLLSDKKATAHGLTYTEALRIPAVLYMYTGQQQLLDAAINGFRKLDRDHMLIDGCPSSNECLAGKNPRVAHETCVVSSYSWGAGYMLMITGNTKWADKIERIIFNAGIGSVTKDFKANQYHSSPNQIISTSKSSHNCQSPSRRMQYRPGFMTQCCSANVNRFLPNYVLRMWLKDCSGGLVAALYGPSEISAKVGDDKQKVTIVERTDYPFSEEIEFEIQTEGKVCFPLQLRIPGWCQRASLSLNGKLMNIETKAGSFVKLDRQFSNNDKIVLSLPMQPKLSFWQEGGIGIERGPLAYSLLIKEDRQIETDPPLSGDVKAHKDFPAWNIMPASPWNYALDVSYNQEKLEKEVEIIHQPMVDNPWAIGASPIRLRVPARRLPDWKPELESLCDEDGTLEDGIRTPRLPAPVLPAGEVEKITLVPLGSTCIRLTIFPDCRYKWGTVACDRICHEDGT